MATETLRISWTTLFVTGSRAREQLAEVDDPLGFLEAKRCVHALRAERHRRSSKREGAIARKCRSNAGDSPGSRCRRAHHQLARFPLPTGEGQGEGVSTPLCCCRITRGSHPHPTLLSA